MIIFVLHYIGAVKRTNIKLSELQCLDHHDDKDEHRDSVENKNIFKPQVAFFAAPPYMINPLGYDSIEQINQG